MTTLPDLEPAGLARCPMCGFSAHLRFEEFFRQIHHFGECQDVDCLTRGPLRLNKAEAAEAWNRRAAISTAPAAEWQEPPLTCPHIDAAVASGELSEAVVDELATIRDINSQLRYGTWALKSQLEAVLAARSTAPEAGKAVAEFAEAILHGDDEHRAWLTEAAVAFNAGQPLPPPRGKGTALASVPAPSGAGPVAQLGAGSPHDLHNVLASVLKHFGPEGANKVTTDALAARPAAQAPQAVPAEDATDWQSNCHKAVDLANRNAARAEASEAEATSLRKALEDIIIECDPADPDWHDQLAGRTTVHRIASLALGASE